MPLDSLSIGANVKGSKQQLLTRSCVVVIAVLSLIVVISCLPHARKSPVRKARTTGSAETCREDATLVHLHVLHRHGVLPTAAEYVDELGCIGHARGIAPGCCRYGLPNVVTVAGERTPIHWFDFEGDWGWEKENLQPGKLTSLGMEHAFHLGQLLKHKYDSKVDFASQKDKVSVFSTNYDRTVDTVRSLLLGIYSDQGTGTKVQDVCACRKGSGARSSAECIASCIGVDPGTLPAVPDVHVRNKSDPAFHQANVCKGWQQWLEELEASDKWISAANDQFSSAEDQIIALADSDKVRALAWPDGHCEACAHVHDPDFNPLDLMEQIWSNLECYIADNKVYHSKASNTAILSSLQPAADYIWHNRYASSKGNMTGGMLLDEMINKLQDVSKISKNCQQSRKGKQCEGRESPPPLVTSCALHQHDKIGKVDHRPMFAGSGASVTIYSAHDTTVYSVLAALGVAEQLPIPRFASHLRMELWETKGCSSKTQFEVRLFYDSETDGASIDSELTQSPACPGGSCSLDNFYKQTRLRVIPAEHCSPQQSSLVTDALHQGCCKD